MEPKGAEMKPQGLPKVPKSLPTVVPHVCQNGSPRCHNGAPRPPKVPKRHHKAPQSATKTPIGANKQNWTRTHWVKPQGTKKHIQTARGRVLAEGDVDPAAGRRDEPTRLPVEVSIEVLRYKYTRALFLKSINWVPPLTPNLAEPRAPKPVALFWDPKTRQKNIEKTGGPNGGSKVENKGPEP